MLNYFGRGGVRAESDLTEDWIWPEPPKEEQDVAPSTDEDKTEGATMANNVIKRKWNMNSMVQIEDLTGMTFQDEAAGHTFEISAIDDAGNAVALSGTPAGVFLRPDNTDQALTCSVSNGKVYATLPAGCYDIPGRFGLTIFLTSNSQTAAIYAAVGTVARTSSGTASPGTTQDVVDLINAINAAIAQIPASDTNLKAAMAPTYSTSALYAVGDYAWYNGVLYKCITAITSGETWTSSHWTAANMGGDVSALKSAMNVNNRVSEANYTPNSAYKADGTIIAKSGLIASAKIPVYGGSTIIWDYSEDVVNDDNFFLVEYTASNTVNDYWGALNYKTRTITLKGTTKYIGITVKLDYVDASVKIGTDVIWKPENGISTLRKDLNEFEESVYPIYPEDTSSYILTGNVFNARSKENLYNFNMTSGGGVTPSTGNMVTHFMSLDDQTYILCNHRNHVYFYNSEKTFLERVIAPTANPTIVTVPSNAKYFRTNGTMDSSDEDYYGSLMIFLSGSMPSAYVPYAYIDANNFIVNGQKLSDVISERKSQWYGLKWSAYGDSITAISNGDSLTNGWAAFVNEIHGFASFYGRGIGGQAYNYGTNGGSVAFVDETTGVYNSRNDSYNKDNYTGDVPTGCVAIRGSFCSWDRITHMYPASIKDNIDLIYIMGGTNDSYVTTEESWIANSTTDPEWAESSYYATYGGDYNITTLKGAIASTIMKMQAWMPQAIIVIGTPLSGRGTTGEIGTNLNVEEYNKSLVVKEMADKASCPCIDVYGTCGINPWNRTTYIYDTVHPYLDAGKMMLGRAVSGGLVGIYPKLSY